MTPEENFTKGEAIEFLESVFGEGIPSNQGLNLSVRCPVCNSYDPSKKKLVIRTDLFVSHCWVCASKEAKNIYRLIWNISPEKAKEFTQKFKRGKLYQQEQQQETSGSTKTLVTLPRDFKLVAVAQTNKTLPYSLKRYLEQRNLTSLSDLWFYKLGFSTEDKELKNRLIFPSFNKLGDLNFYSARLIFEPKANFKLKKYQNPSVPRDNVIINEIVLDFKKELVITEGIFDMFKVDRNSTCLLGSTLSEETLLFQEIVLNKCPTVSLALDPDAKKKAYVLAKKFLEYNIPVKLVFSSSKDFGLSKNRDEYMMLAEKAPIVKSPYELAKFKALSGS